MAQTVPYSRGYFYPADSAQAIRLKSHGTRRLDEVVLELRRCQTSVIEPRLVTVVIADDHALIRRGLYHAVRADSSMVIVGEAANGAEALVLVAEKRPDVLVLDIDMPVANGFAVLRALRKADYRPHVICLSLHNGDDLIQEALSLGASAFLLKEGALPEILISIRHVMAGRQYLSPAIVEARRAARANKDESSEQEPVGLTSLTLTERLVLRGVAHSKTSKAIADDLGTHFRTVENHRTNICRKLELSGSSALLRYALQHLAELE